MNTPPDVRFEPKLRLVTWHPRGVLDEKRVNEILAFLEAQEGDAPNPFHRFTDLSNISFIDLNFEYIISVAVHRRLVYAEHEPVKSAILATTAEATHLAKLHAMLTDHSPLHVAVFSELAAAAEWLGVPAEALAS